MILTIGSSTENDKIRKGQREKVIGGEGGGRVVSEV